MGLQQTLRKYKMADADLIQTADLLEANITRDTADFTLRGVTTFRISQLTTARTVFADYPTDVELQGLVTVAAGVKDGMRYEIEKQVRQIRGMAETQYKGKGFYKTFGFDDLTHQTDNDLNRLVKRVVRVGTSLKDELADQGLTDDMLGDLTTINDQFDENIDNVGKAVETRDLQTEKRIVYGNALFDLVMELANIGKSIYEDKDEAKYNDYVINDTKHDDAPATPVAPAEAAVA